MVRCPNKQAPEWKKLVNELGEITAYKIFLMNKEFVPSMEEVDGIIHELKNTKYGREVALRETPEDKAARVERNRKNLEIVLEKLKRQTGVDYVIINNPNADWRGVFVPKGQPLPNGNYDAPEAEKDQVIINQAWYTPDTPFHEYFHPFIDWLEVENPTGYASLMEEALRDTETVNLIKENYPTLNMRNQIKEIIVTRLGELTAVKAEDRSFWMKLQQFINWVLTKLGLDTEIKVTSVTSLDEIARKVVAGQKFKARGSDIGFQTVPEGEEDTEPVEPEFYEEEEVGFTFVEGKPVADPETQKIIDYLKKNLKQRRAELTRIPPTSPTRREEVQKRIKRIEASIQRLGEQIEMRGVLRIALGEVKRLNALLDSPDVDANDINNAYYAIKSYLNLGDLLATAGGEVADLTEAINKHARLADFKRRELQINLLFENSKLLGLPFTKEDLTEAVEDIGELKMKYLSLGESHIPLQLLASLKLSDMSFLANEQANEFDRKAKEFLKDYTQEDINRIMPNGRLVLPIKHEYFVEEQKQKNIRDLAFRELEKRHGKGKIPFREWLPVVMKYATWVRDNSEIKNAQGQFVDLFPPEYKAHYDKERAKIIADFNMDPETAEQNIREWDTLHNPYTYIEFLRGNTGYNISNRLGYVYLKLGANKAKWGNEAAFNAIVNDQRLEKLYEFVTRSLIEIQGRIPHSYSYELATQTVDHVRFLDSVVADLNDGKFKVVAGAKELMSDVKDSSKTWFHETLSLNDLEGITGRIKDEVTGETRPALRVPGRTRDPDTRAVVHKLTGAKPKTMLEALTDFNKASLLYQHRVEAEPILWLIAKQLNEVPRIEKRAGIPLKEASTGEPSIQKGLKNAYEQLVYRINTDIYDQFKEDSKELIPSASQRHEFEDWKARRDKAIAEGLEVPPIPKIRVLSHVRAIDTLINYTRLKLLSLNPFSGIGNILVGLESNFIFAARGKYFRDEDLFWAFKIMGQSSWAYWTSKFGARQMTPDAQKFSFFMHQLQVLGTHNFEGKDLMTGKIMEGLMTFQQGGEYFVQGQTMLGMLHATKITNNKGEQKTLWDAFVPDGKGWYKFDFANFGDQKEWASYDVFNEDKVNISKLRQFRENLNKARHAIHGDYTNALKVQAKWTGRVFMLFRRWIPQATYQRFGAQVGDDFKGRYLTYRDMGREYGVLKTVGMTAARLVVDLPWVRSIKVNGKSILEMSEDELRKVKLSELDLENYRANIRELQFITFTLLMLAALKGLDPDDEEGLFSTILNYIINQGQRFSQELLFFYSPESALQIVKDFIPLTRTATDILDVFSATWNLVTDPEADTYQRGFREGKSKTLKELTDNIPVLRSIQLGQSLTNQVYGAKPYRP